jgi:serine/threonine protein kinase/WD40 repeat protein
MSAIERNDEVEASGVSPGTVARLVAYDAAKSAEIAGPELNRPAEPSISEISARDLECVDLLHRVWPGFDGPAAAWGPAACVGGLPSPPWGGEPELAQQRLGDFRLMGEIGRGGMGTVFEAEQISMARRVAVKVLPFAALVDEKALARFRNEVRAAAALDHPHIVSIYCVGEERGVHFYAMQLVRGRTLAEVINARRKAEGGVGKEETESALPASPSDFRIPPSTLAKAGLSTLPDSNRREYYRKAARLGIQAAEALQHAHDQGVLHRDIKPSNLLVDGAGQLYVTDFGLARIEADAGMTMTGDILGTLRYMAPEQALAKRVVIDHRADIYSLGATLYELVTLQPAFEETDRSELLKQIAFEEPRPPRKVDPGVPAELESIILKAMNKAREDRYQTAEQLADDLRVFLEHRPIKARPPSHVDRARKWSRRHQTLVRMGVITFLLLTVTLAISTLLVNVARTRALAALEETSELLYSADMTLAYQNLERGWTDEVHPLLERHIPVSGQPDRRGFEWHLLRRFVPPPSFVTLVGHVGPVNELAVFPDHKRLASVGHDGTLRIWDTDNHTPERTIKLCEEPLQSVAVSPDGRFVAAGSTVVYLCDLENGNRVTAIFQSAYTVESLAFSPDRKHLAAGERYDAVALMRLDGEIVQRVACASRVESLEFIPKTRLLLVANRKRQEDGQLMGVLQLWGDDLTRVEAEIDRAVKGRGRKLTVARSSSCGRFIVAGETYSSRTFLFDRAKSRVRGEAVPGRDRLTDVAYSPDGGAVAIAYRDGCIDVRGVPLDADGDPWIDRRPRFIKAHEGEVRSVRFLDAKRMASCGTDGLIRVWGIKNAAAELALDLSQSKANGCQLSPDGSLVLFTSKDEFVLASTESGEVLLRADRPGAEFSSPAWSATGERAAVLSGGERTAIIMDRTGKMVCSVSHGGTAKAIDLSPDGKLAAIVGATDLQLCNANTGQRIVRRPLADAGSRVAFSHDGKLVAHGSVRGTIAFLDVVTREELRRLECDSEVTSLDFSPDDASLATGHGDTHIRLWDVRTGNIRVELVGHERGVRSVLFAPDARTLLSADDGAVRLWSVDQKPALGSIHRRFEPASKSTSCMLSLTPDGTRFAVGFCAEDDSLPDVMIWDLNEIQAE